LVRRDQQAPTLVATRHELKEEMGTASLEGQVAELVDDEELRFAVEGEPLRELPLALGLR